MASKKESTFINLVLTLFVITFISSLTLGFVNELTKAPIQQSKLKKKNDAIKTVVPAFDNEPGKEMFEVKLDNGEIMFCYPAKKDGNFVGLAVETFTTKGFSGEFKIMVGFDAEGKIFNTAVLEHKETPGLGDKMEQKKHKWSLQFIGKHPEKNKIYVTKDGGEIDAITAATISSRAFCDAVEKASQAFKKGGIQ